MFADNVNLLKENNRETLPYAINWVLEVMQTKLFMRLRLIIRMQEKIRDVIVITVSFENVAKLSHVFRNYNIKSNFISTNTLIKLISTNSAYQLVQNILSSYLLFKNLKIKIYRTVVLLALYNLFFTRWHFCWGRHKTNVFFRSTAQTTNCTQWTLLPDQQNYDDTPLYLIHNANCMSYLNKESQCAPS